MLFINLAKDSASMVSHYPITKMEFDLQLTSGRVRAYRSGLLRNTRLVLCLPGLSTNLHCFDYLMTELAHQDLLLVSMDLRGRGKSAITPEGTYGMASHARDMLEMANLLNAEQFDVVGWSMGAMIGVHLAQLAPHRLRRLALIDHTAKVAPAYSQKLAKSLERLDMIIDDPATYVDAIHYSGSISPWHSMWDTHYRYELAPYEHGFKATTSRLACLEDLRDLNQTDFYAMWPRLTMPTLLIHCTKPVVDGWVAADSERDALKRAAPQLQVEEIACDHYAVLQNKRAMQAIQAFLLHG
jgi:pimeloyl-ACP methyl ester carboxylesterase